MARVGQLRGGASLAGRLSLREQSMGDLDTARAADGDREHLREGGRLRTPRRPRRRLRSHRRVRSGPRRACARTVGRWPHARRGDLLSLSLSHDRRRRSDVPESRRDRTSSPPRSGSALRTPAGGPRSHDLGRGLADEESDSRARQRRHRRSGGDAFPTACRPLSERLRRNARAMAVAPSTVMNNVEAVRQTLHDALASDPRTVVLGEDVGARGNVFLITKGFIEEFGPERVIDTPLAEAAIVGVAIGMAMEGLRPIAEIQFADFIYPAFNQIVGEAAKTRYRSNGDYTCPLVIRTPYGGGVRGALSHSVSIEALFYNVPGLKIVAPSYPADMKGLLNAAIDDPDPVLFLEHKKTYRLIKGEVPAGHYTIPIGKAEIKHPGERLTVVSYGFYVHQAVEAAKQLAHDDGVSVEVIDLRSIRPMDGTTILASVRKTRKLLIIHEDNKFGGVGAEIAAMVAEKAFFDLDAPIRRLCGPDVPAMGYAQTLEDEFMIST